MRNMMAIFLLLCGFQVVTHAQEVKKLEAGQAPGKATIDQISWLAGYWEGTGFGGNCTELWLPAADKAMQGIFRFVLNDTLIFTEYMHLIEEDSSLTIKLKHYGKDLEGWEEKSEWTTFKLVSIENQTAYFSGLTYSVTGNKLLIRLTLKEGDQVYTEDFNFKRIEK
ncbi:MAG TPA: DUF6265 family protein [Chitinophagales bacterium]|nr:DUF6265 family protein [Chitinophagales bacterium]